MTEPGAEGAGGTVGATAGVREDAAVAAAAAGRVRTAAAAEAAVSSKVDGNGDGDGGVPNVDGPSSDVAAKDDRVDSIAGARAASSGVAGVTGDAIAATAAVGIDRGDLDGGLERTRSRGAVVQENARREKRWRGQRQQRSKSAPRRRRAPACRRR